MVNRLIRRLIPGVPSDPVIATPEVLVFGPDQLDLGHSQIQSVVVEQIVRIRTSPDLSVISGGSPQPHFDPVRASLPRTLPWAELGVLGSEVKVSENLSQTLATPQIYGTIYIRTGATSAESAQGQNRKQPSRPSEPRRGRTNAREPVFPSTTDLFELLVPILLPPPSAKPGEKLELPHELRPYQREGVRFLYQNEAALLADDMGLGKTVQALVALRVLIREGSVFRVLIVCPKSVARHWRKEAFSWAPELKTFLVEGSAPARAMAWNTSAFRSHIAIATYGTIRNDVEQLANHTFDLIVADEVHTIRNPNAQQTHALKAIEAKRRWGLSGTPMTGKLTDLESVFGFIAPGRFSDLAQHPPRVVQDLIAPYVKRRSRTEVLPELPEKVSAYVPLELTTEQRETYDKAQHDGVVYLKGLGEITLQHVFALIATLKQICNFDPKTRSSCKLEYLNENLPAMLSGNAKALVFSQYLETLRVLKSEFGEYQPLEYHGSLSTAERESVITRFETDENSKLLVLSLGAGGQGLNLQRANYVVHFDKWWNPAVTRQAEDRVHRYGQERTVFVTHFVCVDTIEERIEQILERKRALFGEVFEGLTDDDLSGAITPQEFFELFDLKMPERYQAGRGKAAEPAPPDQEFQESVVEDSQPIEKEAFALIRELEIELRSLIREMLAESNPSWWRSKWPEGVWKAAEQRAKKAGVAVWGTSTMPDPCDFLEMGDYVQIIERGDNWKASFRQVFGDAQNIRVYLGQLLPIRNAIMHSRVLSEEQHSDLRTFVRLIRNAMINSRVAVQRAPNEPGEPESAGMTSDSTSRPVRPAGDDRFEEIAIESVDAAARLRVVFRTRAVKKYLRRGQHACLVTNVTQQPLEIRIQRLGDMTVLALPVPDVLAVLAGDPATSDMAQHLADALAYGGWRSNHEKSALVTRWKQNTTKRRGQS